MREVEIPDHVDLPGCGRGGLALLLLGAVLLVLPAVLIAVAIMAGRVPA